MRPEAAAPGWDPAGGDNLRGSSAATLRGRPRRHLADFHGILQADAYASFRELYEPGPDGVACAREAAWWAHHREVVTIALWS